MGKSPEAMVCGGGLEFRPCRGCQCRPLFLTPMRVQSFRGSSEAGRRFAARGYRGLAVSAVLRARCADSRLPSFGARSGRGAAVHPAAAVRHSRQSTGRARARLGPAPRVARVAGAVAIVQPAHAWQAVCMWSIGSFPGASPCRSATLAPVRPLRCRPQQRLGRHRQRPHVGGREQPSRFACRRVRPRWLR